MSLSTKQLTMLTVSLALFMDVLDTNIINTAIPVMADNFNVSPVDLKIALISYLLSLAVFIPISGWTADRYGAKRIFISALALFTMSSFWCGYATTLTDLVIGRSIQGVGGAFMISLGRLIIARTFQRHELVEAMNAVIIVVAVAVMVGPFLGGVITEHLSWPWIFWVNIPAGCIAIALAAYGLEDTAPRYAKPFDFFGFVLFGGSLSLMCFALSELSESNNDFIGSLELIVVASLMLLCCLVHARYHPHPVIKTDLFQIRTYRISVFGNLFSRLGFGGIPFLLPLLQQIGLGFSAQLSGLLLVPIALGIIFSKLLAFRVLRKSGYRTFLVLNTLCVALLISAFQLINKDSSVYFIAGLTFAFGVFTAAQYTGMNSLAYADVNPEDLSASTSITSTVQVLAQTLGVAVSAILLRVYSSASPHPELSVTVFHNTFFTISLLTLFSIVIFINLKNEDGQQMLVERDPA